MGYRNCGNFTRPYQNDLGATGRLNAGFYSGYYTCDSRFSVMCTFEYKAPLNPPAPSSKPTRAPTPYAPTRSPTPTPVPIAASVVFLTGEKFTGDFGDPDAICQAQGSNSSLPSLGTDADGRYYKAIVWSASSTFSPRLWLPPNGPVATAEGERVAEVASEFFQSSLGTAPALLVTSSGIRCFEVFDHVAFVSLFVSCGSPSV